MKPIIYALLLLIITSCASQQSTIKNADVIYEAVTRGSSKKLPLLITLLTTRLTTLQKLLQFL